MKILKHSRKILCIEPFKTTLFRLRYSSILESLPQQLKFGKSLEARSLPASPPMVLWNGAALAPCPTSPLPGISQRFRTTSWTSKKRPTAVQTTAGRPLWVGTAFSVAWCQDTSLWRTTMRRGPRLGLGAWCRRSRETRATSTPLWKFRTLIFECLDPFQMTNYTKLYTLYIRYEIAWTNQN